MNGARKSINLTFQADVFVFYIKSNKDVKNVKFLQKYLADWFYKKRENYIK